MCRVVSRGVNTTVTVIPFIFASRNVCGKKKERWHLREIHKNKPLRRLEILAEEKNTYLDSLEDEKTNLLYFPFPCQRFVYQWLTLTRRILPHPMVDAVVVAFWFVVIVALLAAAAAAVVVAAAVVCLVEVYLYLLPPWLLVVVLAKHDVQPLSILVFWVELPSLVAGLSFPFFLPSFYVTGFFKGRSLHPREKMDG